MIATAMNISLTSVVYTASTNNCCNQRFFSEYDLVVALTVGIVAQCDKTNRKRTGTSSVPLSS